MSDLRPSIAILEDASTQAGLPWTKVAAGDSATGKNAGAVLSCKDESGNLQYLPMSGGKILVDTELLLYAQLPANGQVSGGNASLTTVATITLQNSKTYRNLQWLASCFRDTLFEISKVDNGTPTVIARMRVNGSENNASGRIEDEVFTSGATGAQTLVIKGKNINALSDFDATISIQELS